MADLSTTDLAVRRAVYARFAAGGAPALAEVAGDLAMARDAVRASFERLALAHVLVLEPGTHELRMAMPFSAVPTAFRVEGLGRQWFANCAWDAFGIAAALSCDVIITTDCLDCRAEMIYGIRAGAPTRRDGVVHFSVPAQRWWDDIVLT